MAGPKPVAEPHKELRFTRAAQAQTFWVIGAILGALGLLLLVTWFMGHPAFRFWMPVPAFTLAIIFIRFALKLTRHAYVILTPLGVEIFPLRKPETNIHLLYWTELQEAEFNEDLTLMKLHRDKAKTSGVILSLKPILQDQRRFLKKAIEARLKESTKIS